MKRQILLLVVISMATILSTQIVEAQECMIGDVKIFAGNFAPRNWAFAHGQLLPISQNTVLYSLLGTTYGGDGRTTFALPDLRGRFPIGTGQGPGLSVRELGQKGGTENVTLDVTQIPSHNHSVNINLNTASVSATLRAYNGDPDRATAGGNALANAEIYSSQAPNVDMNNGTITATITGTAAGTTGLTGGSQPHTNMPPFLGMNYIICLQGIFPPRS
jgi:microcystin-dependent protein